MNVFKDKVNLEDLCSLETDKIDRFLDDVENAKDNIISCYNISYKNYYILCQCIHNIIGNIFDVIFNLYSQEKVVNHLFLDVMLVLKSVRICLHCCLIFFLMICQSLFHTLIKDDICLKIVQVKC